MMGQHCSDCNIEINDIDDLVTNHSGLCCRCHLKKALIRYADVYGPQKRIIDRDQRIADLEAEVVEWKKTADTAAAVMILLRKKAEQVQLDTLREAQVALYELRKPLLDTHGAKQGLAVAIMHLDELIAQAATSAEEKEQVCVACTRGPACRHCGKSFCVDHGSEHFEDCRVDHRGREQ